MMQLATHCKQNFGMTVSSEGNERQISMINTDHGNSPIKEMKYECIKEESKY
jgi:hypothetical protein